MVTRLISMSPSMMGVVTNINEMQHPVKEGLDVTQKPGCILANINYAGVMQTFNRTIGVSSAVFLAPVGTGR